MKKLLSIILSILLLVGFAIPLTAARAPIITQQPRASTTTWRMNSGESLTLTIEAQLPPGVDSELYIVWTIIDARFPFWPLLIAYTDELTIELEFAGPNHSVATSYFIAARVYYICDDGQQISVTSRHVNVSVHQTYWQMLRGVWANSFTGTFIFWPIRWIFNIGTTLTNTLIFAMSFWLYRQQVW